MRQLGGEVEKEGPLRVSTSEELLYALGGALVKTIVDAQEVLRGLGEHFELRVGLRTAEEAAVLRELLRVKAQRRVIATAVVIDLALPRPRHVDLADHGGGISRPL